MILSEVVVEIVRPEEEGRFRELMQSHHYLGAMPKIGETLWYVAHVDGTWLALAVFSAPALKCRARDSWVGWDFRYQYGRLHLVSNNSRLLILPGHHYRNLGSRFLGLCARRIVGDWPARFGHPLLLLETFVDPARFQGTVYRAANWQAVGHSRGSRRRPDGRLSGCYRTEYRHGERAGRGSLNASAMRGVREPSAEGRRLPAS